jgi:hypothetical protein
MTEILQDSLPPEMAARLVARLPGLAPVDPPADWLRRDDAFAAQMAERDHLLSARPEEVMAETPGSGAAQAECLEAVLALLRDDPGYRVTARQVRRPDGVEVPLDPNRLLLTLGRLVQEDLCLIEKRGEAHVLSAAVLCFPASWMLSEKIGRSLDIVHRPVRVYDADLARRVDRIFDGVQPGRPVWRANLLPYADPALFQPRSEADRRPREDAGAGYARSERQCIRRLPRSGAAVFTIHTYVVRQAALSPQEQTLMRHAEIYPG